MYQVLNITLKLYLFICVCVYMHVLDVFMPENMYVYYMNYNVCRTQRDA